MNIEQHLGYTYGPGSLEDQIGPGPLAAADTEELPTTRAVKVTGLNRAAIRGSFLIGTFLKIDGKRYHVGSESVLSRWSIQGCANCQTHLEVKAFIGLHGLADEDLTGADYEVEVRTRDGVLHEHRAIVSLFHKKAFHVQLK